jgi:pimeloyl-ACP methyl ester carboxylesterase
LFEEMNRTRAFLVSTMRKLAAEGFGCWLPDLPGTGESQKALESCGWMDWRNAIRDAGAHIAEACGRQPLTASFRGGALLDDAVAAAASWRFAPAEGSSLARDLIRSSLLAAEAVTGPLVELAGYRLSATLLADLEGASFAQPKPLRTVRIESDRGEADLKLAAPALWRRSEPANSPETVALIASDIRVWCASCGI